MTLSAEQTQKLGAWVDTYRCCFNLVAQLLRGQNPREAMGCEGQCSVTGADGCSSRNQPAIDELAEILGIEPEE